MERRFVVWAVYATVENKVNVRVEEYSYREKQLAEIRAAELKHGYVVMKKVSR